MEHNLVFSNNNGKHQKKFIDVRDDIKYLRDVVLKSTPKKVKLPVKSSDEHTACQVYIEKDYDEHCLGSEDLPDFTYESITWDSKRNKADHLSTKEEANQRLDEYDCLIRFYRTVYKGVDFVADDVMEEGLANPFKVKNDIYKFKRIQMLGTVYGSVA